MSKTIKIESFNPYLSRFPNRKLITKGTLELIKELRVNGYSVIVTPENDTPVQYLFQKGVHDFFSDPVIAYIIGVPTGIVVNIISNYIQKAFDKWGQSAQSAENIIIIMEDVTQIFSLNNKTISKSEITNKRKKRDKQIKEFEKCFSLKSPYKDLPTPLFSNHKPKIIGWGRLKLTPETLEFEDSIIFDKTAKRKIKEGKIRGASVTGIADKSICSICKLDYINCNHIAGDKYDDAICSNEIHEATLIEVSLVKEPVNEKCILTIKK